MTDTTTKTAEQSQIDSEELTKLIPRYHVVLLDDSGSMRDRLDEGTAFDSGVDMVRKLVAEGSRRPGTQKFTLIRLSQPDQPLAVVTVVVLKKRLNLTSS